ncbi:hypothetical protein RAS1_29100 [Phycisphaerae bacterium RAS1]|nr:hypothetical protein RAS1_29100 [Phycisphaerae bacterium RAS1]
MPSSTHAAARPNAPEFELSADESELLRLIDGVQFGRFTNRAGKPAEPIGAIDERLLRTAARAVGMSADRCAATMKRLIALGLLREVSEFMGELEFHKLIRDTTPGCYGEAEIRIVRSDPLDPEYTAFRIDPAPPAGSSRPRGRRLTTRPRQRMTRLLDNRAVLPHNLGEWVMPNGKIVTAKPLDDDSDALRSRRHAIFVDDDPVDVVLYHRADNPRRPAKRRIVELTDDGIRATAKPGSSIDTDESTRAADPFDAIDSMYRSVRFRGTAYQFTPRQASAIQFMHQRFNVGTPDCQDAEILEILGNDTDNTRLDHVFRLTIDRSRQQHPAWGVVVIRSERKGMHRLAPREIPRQSHR